MNQPRPSTQHGAALVAAMLTVALVATLAAGAMWQQWRTTEVESASRARAQARWLLTGALDWARVILREDSRASQGNNVDHLAEPWAIPLQEAKLSSFVSALPDGSGSQVSDAIADQVWLSGQISDAQGKLNLSTLIQGDKLDAAAWRSWSRLFDALGLPPQELQQLSQGLASVGREGGTPMPQHVSQLAWWGLRPATLAALAPHVGVLPQRTAVNVNTASAEVLFAITPSLSLTQAQQLVNERARRAWTTLEDFNKASGASSSSGMHSVNSTYFEVWGQLRMGPVRLQERSLVQRDGIDTKVLWRLSGHWATTPGLAQTVASASLQ